MADAQPTERGTSGFANLCLGQFLGHQTCLTFSALIPIVSDEWRLSASHAGLILGAFQLGNLLAYVGVGFLLDRIRSKPVMVWAAVLVGLGDLLFALGARGFWSGLGLRLLVGISLGGLYLPALKHIAESIPTARRGTATGTFIGILVAGYAASLFYVGVLATRIGWRMTMAGVGMPDRSNLPSSELPEPFKFQPRTLDVDLLFWNFVSFVKSDPNMMAST